MSDKKLADAYDKAMEELVVLEAEIARLTTELADVQRYRQAESANARKLQEALEATDRRLAELDYHTTSPLRIAIRKALANDE